MENSDTKVPTYLIVILVFVALVTGVLITLYIRQMPPKSSIGNAITHGQKTPGPEATPQAFTTKNLATTSVEGYVQEIRPKTWNEESQTYMNLVGLISRGSEVVQVWLTEEEFTALKFYYNEAGVRREATIDDVKGGQLLRVLEEPSGTEGGKSVVIEIVR